MTAVAKPGAWLRHAAGCAALAVLAHLITIWLAPTVVMRAAGHKILAMAQASKDAGQNAADQGKPHNTALHSPPVTAQSRSIVMPSPDMLYSVCIFDLARGPLHISANPALPSYWSIALYGANSDNFFVRNDRQAQGKPVDLTLVSRNSPQAGQPGVLTAPSDTGVLLMRVLTGNYEAEKATLEPARRTLQCTTPP